MSWDDNDSGDFFFYSGSGSSGNLSAGGTVIVLIILLAILMFLVWSNKVGKENDRKVLTYIDTHQCKIDSFMGGDQKKRAVYQCVDGRMLDFELREKALK